jgi:hypothetical protein
MPHDLPPIPLTPADLRAVAAYAAACARPPLPLFERHFPDDPRPRAAIDAAQAFADGAPRTKALRDAAWAAQRAAHDARDAHHPAASQAARAALAAAGAPFLHPLAKPTQVKHILGAAAHAAHALELAQNDPTAATAHLTTAHSLAPPTLISLLKRYPPVPPGRTRVAKLLHHLDTTLRTPPPSFP